MTTIEVPAYVPKTVSVWSRIKRSLVGSPPCSLCGDPLYLGLERVPVYGGGTVLLAHCDTCQTSWPRARRWGLL